MEGVSSYLSLDPTQTQFVGIRLFHISYYYTITPIVYCYLTNKNPLKSLYFHYQVILIGL